MWPEDVRPYLLQHEDPANMLMTPWLEQWCVCVLAHSSLTLLLFTETELGQQLILYHQTLPSAMTEVVELGLAQLKIPSTCIFSLEAACISHLNHSLLSFFLFFFFFFFFILFFIPHHKKLVA